MNSTLLVIFALGFVTIFGVMQILFHLEQKIRFRCPKGEKFGIWSEIKSVIFDEYEVGYVDRWMCGHKFSVICNVQSSEPKGITRANIQFFSSNDALSQNEVVGYGKSTDGHVKISVTLKPSNASDLLQELRNSPNGNLHLHGVTTENKGIHITHFSFSPQLDDA